MRKEKVKKKSQQSSKLSLPSRIRSSLVIYRTQEKTSSNKPELVIWLAELVKEARADAKMCAGRKTGGQQHQ